MQHQKTVNSLLSADGPVQGIELSGWVRTKRDAKDFSFIELNDGSCLANIQVIVDADLENYSSLRHIATGAAVRAHGDLIESPGKGQKWEIRASAVEVVGAAPEDYPLQKKRHSDEFLRTIAHLRPAHQQVRRHVPHPFEAGTGRSRLLRGARF